MSTSPHSHARHERSAPRDGAGHTSVRKQGGDSQGHREGRGLEPRRSPASRSRIKEAGVQSLCGCSESGLGSMAPLGTRTWTQ